MRVVVGLERILDDVVHLVRGRRVGLVVNPTSVTPELEHAIDLFDRHDDVKLTAIFGPEHGARGEAQDMIGVDEEVDSRTKLPMFSLYGSTQESLAPTKEMLNDVDVLVVDIQDIGSRYYTYIYTMSYCMEAAAEFGRQVIVLDRPNPLSGEIVEGNVLRQPMRSFVGRYPIPVRHGMTAGELARLFNAEFKIGCDLSVVELRGWNRAMWFDDTELPWVIPSPNMPTLETATVYPGMCLIEGTNASEGRGTTRPFEIIGAPWIDPYLLTESLTKEQLPGIAFRPHFFQPTFQKHAGSRCAGIQLHVRDRDAYCSYRTGIAIIRQLYHLFGDDFDWRQEPYEFETDRLAIDLLLGNDSLRELIEANRALTDIEAEWSEELEDFRELRKDYLLY